MESSGEVVPYLLMDIVKTFEDLGWKCELDEAGDNSCTYELSDRIVQIVPQKFNTGDSSRINFNESVSSKKFNEVAVYIRGSKNYYSVESPSVDMIFTDSEITYSDINEVSEKIIDWAKNFDLESKINELANLPTDCKGNLAVKHLAALVITKNIEKLNFYKNSFMSGDKLNFVPYITEDFIDRAIELCDKN